MYNIIIIIIIIKKQLCKEAQQSPKSLQAVSNMVCGMLLLFFCMSKSLVLGVYHRIKNSSRDSDCWKNCAGNANCGWHLYWGHSHKGW